jgi:[ribosomal protein S5]-alanine N-acetyltransferase
LTLHVADTERLSLRHLALTDAAFILELVNDPDWLRNIGDRGIHTEDAARDYITHGPCAMYARFGFGLYRVELRKSGIPIGLCGLVKRDWLDDVDMGYALLPAYRGQGYAHEAAASTLNHGRTALGLKRVAAIVSPGNTDSIRLLERLGLRFERMVTPPTASAAICVYVTETNEDPRP